MIVLINPLIGNPMKTAKQPSKILHNIAKIQDFGDSDSKESSKKPIFNFKMPKTQIETHVQQIGIKRSGVLSDKCVRNLENLREILTKRAFNPLLIDLATQKYLFVIKSTVKT